MQPENTSYEMLIAINQACQEIILKQSSASVINHFELIEINNKLNSIKKALNWILAFSFSTWLSFSLIEIIKSLIKIFAHH